MRFARMPKIENFVAEATKIGEEWWNGSLQSVTCRVSYSFTVRLNDWPAVAIGAITHFGSVPSSELRFLDVIFTEQYGDRTIFYRGRVLREDTVISNTLQQQYILAARETT